MTCHFRLYFSLVSLPLSDLLPVDLFLLLFPYLSEWTGHSSLSERNKPLFTIERERAGHSSPVLSNVCQIVVLCFNSVVVVRCFIFLVSTNQSWRRFCSCLCPCCWLRSMSWVEERFFSSVEERFLLQLRSDYFFSFQLRNDFFSFQLRSDFFFSWGVIIFSCTAE